MAAVAALALALTLGIGAGVGAFALRPALITATHTQVEQATVSFGAPAPPAAMVTPAEKLDPGLREMLRETPRIRMLVHVRGEGALGELEAAGLQVGAHHPLVGMVEITGGRAEVARLAALPCVRRVACPLPPVAGERGLRLPN